MIVVIGCVSVTLLWGRWTKISKSCGRYKALTVLAGDDVLAHEELVDVEQDPGEVTNEEEEDDAEEDGRQVHLARLLLVVLLRPLVRHPAMNLAINTFHLQFIMFNI